MQTQAVLARYRELGSTLEAAVQVREESEESGEMHWHRMHERCWCGFLTVPTQCYEYKDGRQVSTQEEAEKVYLENRTETPRTESPAGNKRTGRPKKWASEAERLKAYRGRSK